MIFSFFKKMLHYRRAMAHDIEAVRLQNEFIFSQLKSINMNQQELAQQLTELAAQTAKAKEEVLAQVAELENKIVQAGTLTPEVEAALAALKESVQAIDDINPDAPTGGEEPGNEA